MRLKQLHLFLLQAYRFSPLRGLLLHRAEWRTWVLPLTLTWSKARASTRFFSTSLSQWILIVSRMSSRLVPMGTSTCSSSDTANCLYSTFTSWKNGTGKENTWNSRQQKPSSVGNTSASHPAIAKHGASQKLAKSPILFPAWAPWSLVPGCIAHASLHRPRPNATIKISK